MPVKDELQPKNAENNIKKSEKLIPFLNVKAETHQSKINSIDVKIATKEDKISRNKAGIEKLTAKADRLEDRNTMLKNMFGNVPAVN